MMTDAAYAAEVLGHVEWQHHILLQQPLGRWQARNGAPAHAWRLIHYVPAQQRELSCTLKVTARQPV